MEFEGDRTLFVLNLDILQGLQTAAVACCDCTCYTRLAVQSAQPESRDSYYRLQHTSEALGVKRFARLPHELFGVLKGHCIL